MRVLLLLFAAMSLGFAQMAVSVSILPQKFFVQKVAGDKVSVQVMVQPGNSPATYEPTPKQMMELSKTQLYFSIGVPFEKRWLERFQQAALDTVFVDAVRGIEKLPMQKHMHAEQDHGHGAHREHEEHDHHEDEANGHHDEDHAGLDPHVWLDPGNVKVIARNISEALIQADPASKDYYEANLRTFLDELDTLDRQIKSLLQNRSSDEFIVFHPSWGYYAKAYGLTQVPIEIEGKNPKQKDLMELIRFAKEHGIKAVFVAPEFSQKSAEMIAKSIGGETISVSPVAPQWDKNLLQMSKALAKVLD